MYSPNLRYLFIAANSRSLWPQLSLMKYLEALGIPPLVICQLEVDRSTVLSQISNAILVDDVPIDFNVAFSTSAGLDDFERECLIKSRAIGKINIKLHNSMSTNNTIENPNYTTERVDGRIHGICTREQRAIRHFQKFLPDVFYLNTGDPDWDYFRTQEFKGEVDRVHKWCGKKLLLICSPFKEELGEFEVEFWKLVIDWAERIGFRVVIRSHPGRATYVPKELRPFLHNEIHRHVIFAAASHVLVANCSTVIGECMLLGTKVGSFPMVPHNGKYGKHDWIDDPVSWHNITAGQIGKDLLSYLPYVHTRGTLNEFLSSPNPLISQEQMDSIWGWPRVDCYSEYLFKCVEEKVS